MIELTLGNNMLGPTSLLNFQLDKLQWKLVSYSPLKITEEVLRKSTNLRCSFNKSSSLMSLHLGHTIDTIEHVMVYII